MILKQLFWSRATYLSVDYIDLTLSSSKLVFKIIFKYQNIQIFTKELHVSIAILDRLKVYWQISVQN